MNASLMIHLKLSDCYLCECGAVGNNSARCPACANEHGLLNLETVLNREAQETSEKPSPTMKPFNLAEALTGSPVVTRSEIPVTTLRKINSKTLPRRR